MGKSRRWIDIETLVITVPGRENNDGTVTPAEHFVCDVQTLPTGKKRIVFEKKGRKS